MTSAVQSVQVAFTEWLAKLLGNPTFAAQAVGDIPGSLAAEGISEDQLQYLNVQQAVTDACNYPGVPPAAKAALQPVAHTAPPPPPQTYTEVVQQLQVVNNYVNNEVIDNSTNVTVGDNFSGDLTLDNDVTTVEGNENVVGDNNETANIDIDAGGGDGGTATGGAGGTATSTAQNNNATDQEQFGAGATGETGEPGGPSANANQNNNTPQTADSDADADGGDADASGGSGGNIGPININFGDDINEGGPGDQLAIPVTLNEAPSSEETQDQPDPTVL